MIKILIIVVKLKNNFWFYFFGIPVLFGIVCLSILFTLKIANEPPIFNDALEYCKYMDNNIVYSDMGTSQDLCIDDFMVLPWEDWVIILLFLGLIGLFFLIPLSVYYIIRLFNY